MKLDTWLRARQWTDTKLATELGCTPQAARLWRMGLRRPTPEFQVKIGVLTNGAVSQADMERSYQQRKRR